MPYAAADPVTIEADTEQLSCGSVESGQVEVHPERLAASHLHRGEMAGAAPIEGPDLLDGRGTAVDLNARRTDVTHEGGA